MIQKALVLALLVCGSVILASHSVNAQRKIITYREFYDGTRTITGVPWYERSRRVETTRETFNSGSLLKSFTSVSEVLLPDRNRYYTKTVEDGKISEIEVIKIDYMQYTRKDGSPWTKIDLRQQATGGGYGSGTGSARASCDQYSVESVFLNGMSVKLFEWLDVGSSGDELQYTETKKWVGDDGLPYRQELVKGKLYPRTETWKEVIIYDYNPNFKIEAPIN